MKFCLAICEYDPFHNGHLHHISEMKKIGAQFNAVIMSGNFTQRGGIAVMDKYTRARHAILAGADVVFELPTVFATAPAEIFAKGAIKCLFALGNGNALVFGSEYGEKGDYLSLGRLCLNETKEFKQVLKTELDKGVPFAVARTNAIKEVATNEKTEMLEMPNCILGLEYTKAILESQQVMDIFPIKRESGFNDVSLNGKFCSAKAIREAISRLKHKKIKKFVPKYVFDELPKRLPDASLPMLYSLLESNSSELKNIIDCTEGLENRIKVICRSVSSQNELIERLETKRYTRARLSRVALASMLKIDRNLVSKCLKTPLYLKVLAVAEDKKEVLSEISKGLEQTKTVLITRKTDVNSLSGTALDCFEKDVFANDVYNLIVGKKTNEYDMKIIERKC